MNITGRPKTSIYTHIRDIPLSEERWKEIRRNAGLHIRQYSISRKGKSNRDFKKFRTWTPELVLLVSHLLFDGEITRGRCNYNNRSTALIGRVERLMRLVYEYEPKRYVDAVTGVTKLRYYNVALEKYLQEKAVCLLEEISAMPFEFKREFLRAFFDDEGCMYIRKSKNVRKIRGYQKDVRILYLVQGLLSDFSIESRIHKPNEVVITQKHNLIRFQQEIGFSPGVCINGERSNSLWKESLEKRELLQRAIESFKS
jgi:hypothetical protein